MPRDGTFVAFTYSGTGRLRSLLNFNLDLLLMPRKHGGK